LCSDSLSASDEYGRLPDEHGRRHEHKKQFPLRRVEEIDRAIAE
jgi:hypothetical protein